MSDESNEQVLSHKKDPVYGGVTVSTVCSCCDQENSPSITPCLSPAQLDHGLELSLPIWRSEGVREVSIRVPLKHSELLAVLHRHGFEYHHARGNHAQLQLWLPTEQACTVPKYPFTTIGVGGLVVSNDNKILLMKERRGRYFGWKFPGGFAEHGENIFDTACREVLEETGVECQGDFLVTFRHSTGVSFRWHCDDMYFVVAVSPSNGLDADRNIVKLCPQETAACRWFSRAELSTLDASEFPQFHQDILRQYDLCMANGARTQCRSQQRQFNNKTYHYKMYDIAFTTDPEQRISAAPLTSASNSGVGKM